MPMLPILADFHTRPEKIGHRSAAVQLQFHQQLSTAGTQSRGISAAVPTPSLLSECSASLLLKLGDRSHLYWARGVHNVLFTPVGPWVGGECWAANLFSAISEAFPPFNTHI